MNILLTYQQGLIFCVLVGEILAARHIRGFHHPNENYMTQSEPNQNEFPGPFHINGASYSYNKMKGLSNSHESSEESDTTSWEQSGRVDDSLDRMSHQLLPHNVFQAMRQRYPITVPEGQHQYEDTDMAFREPAFRVGQIYSNPPPSRLQVPLPMLPQMPSRNALFPTQYMMESRRPISPHTTNIRPGFNLYEGTGHKNNIESRESSEENISHPSSSNQQRGTQYEEKNLLF